MKILSRLLVAALLIVATATSASSLRLTMSSSKIAKNGLQRNDVCSVFCIGDNGESDLSDDLCKIICDPENSEELTSGYNLAKSPHLNKGTSFTTVEREILKLRGLVPAGQPISLDAKVDNLMELFRAKTSPIEKYIFLHTIQDSDETLYYAALVKHVTELLPFVYTPTVGEACRKWSSIYRQTPRGLYLSIKDRGSIRSILDNYPLHNIQAIVVTDGERILGLGDQGVNGMGIPIGKLALYTACAGVNPSRVLPVHIDVGTDREEYLKDPMYMGLRQKRDRSEAYDELIQEFFDACQDKYGKKVLIQFEDFGNSNAFRLLDMYRTRANCFNDDIQGTASVVVAGVLASLGITGKEKVSDHKFLFYGAGGAAVGIADLLVTAMLHSDPTLTSEEARKRIWLVDSQGLVTSCRTEDLKHKKAYAHEEDNCSLESSVTALIDAIKLIQPTALIGVSAQGQAFTKEVCEEMAAISSKITGKSLPQKPLIFALSNPTSKAECTAAQAYEWTEGNVVFASGSPFDPVDVVTKAGKRMHFVPGQGNNAYIFPGVGLGALVSESLEITDEDFYIAASVLAGEIGPESLAVGCAYPPFSKIRNVSLKIAAAVAENIVRTGRASSTSPFSTRSTKADYLRICEHAMYMPSYN